ncbi:MAG: hypothetical protein IT453_09625 [Planctomycetes bacterium]|nr:hypothetical protein [Planctomycetota bacterium]
MNDQRPRLESLFAAAREQRVPAGIEQRLRERLALRAPRTRASRRRLVLAAAALVVLGGLVGAAVARWWRVEIDTREQRIEGGTLRELRRGRDGATQYELELPDGRRVTVEVPAPSNGERRIEVELPDSPPPRPDPATNQDPNPVPNPEEERR